MGRRCARAAPSVFRVRRRRRSARDLARAGASAADVPQSAATGAADEAARALERLLLQTRSLCSYDGVHARQDDPQNKQRALTRAHCQHRAQPAAGLGSFQSRLGAGCVLSQRLEVVSCKSNECSLQTVQGCIASSHREGPGTHRKAALTQCFCTPTMEVSVLHGRALLSM